MQSPLNPQLVLATTSAYKKSLLHKMQIPFSAIDPEYEEVAIPGEKPLETAARLALGKATMAYQNLRKNPECEPTSLVIIGCDQVAHLGDTIFHKPGDHNHAIEQLLMCSGQWVSFTTAVSLLYQGEQHKQAAECYKIRYRKLSHSAIEDYLRRDKPYDCAGSIKLESLGITLVEDSQGRDVNALFGLPLMLLQDLLASINYPLSALR